MTIYYFTHTVFNDDTQCFSPIETCEADTIPANEFFKGYDYNETICYFATLKEAEQYIAHNKDYDEESYNDEY